MSIISSHTGFQPLKEVWLGDVYPDAFYTCIQDSKLRDLVYQIAELTRQDLTHVQNTIESFGVTVCRPEFDTSADRYLDHQGNLLKPPITPRDWGLTLGDHLRIIPQYPSRVEPFQTHIDRYTKHGQKVTVLERFCNTPEDWCWITFPSVVRVGRDLFVDYNDQDARCKSAITNIAAELSNNYRIHLSNTNDHVDGVFCPVTPGHIAATHYRTHYDQGWPGWNVISLPDTTKNNGHNGKWWLPGVDYCHFNSSMTEFFDQWLGDPHETVFEVNMLVIDEQNVLVLAYDDTVCRRLENVGITPHVVDFRTRGVWDGGLHCLTVDIHRTGPKLDYWPGRGTNGIDNIS